MKLKNELKKIIESLLWEDGQNIMYDLRIGRNTSNYELACETTAGVLRKCGMNDFRIHIFHDAFGAPLAEVYDVSSTHGKTVPYISLTDELGIHVCLAVCSVSESGEKDKVNERRIKSKIIGVGIDLAEIEDISDVLKVSSERFARWFSREEKECLKDLNQIEASVYAAGLFSKREAAFKSANAVYRKYREKNGGRPLPVSFMDFTFPEGERAVPRKMTAEIFRKENLQISVKRVHCGKMVAAAAVCRRQML